MSTSDPGFQFDEDAIAQARSAVGAIFPDVATLTQMANEFFRALPNEAGQNVTGSSLPAATGLPALPSVPGSPSFPMSYATAIPGTEMRQPQFGVPAPSVPSLPSIDKVPSEAEVARMVGGGITANSPSVVSAFTGIPSLSSINATAPATSSFPSQAAFADTSTPFASVSPFSLPLPDFNLPFPNFEASLPSIPPLAALGTEDGARSAVNVFSHFYFLEHAGALSQPIIQDSRPTPYPTQSYSPVVVPDLGSIRRQFDVTSIRNDFPILREKVNGRPLIWLDNAATTQKPQAVIDRLKYFYEHENSNIHRAAHDLAARATDAYEDARSKVAHFLNASSSKEIVFVRGATEAINLVAQSWGRQHINKGDEIVISWIEHHANIVPWQMLAAEKGAILRVIPVDDSGQILLDEYEKLLSSRTKLVSFTHVSNALGTITPAQQMVQMAHRYGACVLVDGAQAVSHMRVDVQSLDADFYVFSGHKVFGPTGIGVLYGKPDALADSPPWQGGGNMIADVTFEKTIYQPPPFRFEAGTGNIADAVGLGAAIAYLDTIGMENISRHEHELLIYVTQELLKIPGLCIIGTAKDKAGVLSFVLDGYKTEDVGAALNREGIAVRSGHHCAQPTLRRFGQETTVRPSLALYNNYDDIDAMIAALRRLKQLPA
jgi:cysteine desulfurase/selenocysteine lyase